MFGEPFGNGPADAARGAGDDRDAAGQVEQTGQDFLRWTARRVDDCIVRRADARGGSPHASRCRDGENGRSVAQTALAAPALACCLLFRLCPLGAVTCVTAIWWLLALE
jgi:hypothetical protein